MAKHTDKKGYIYYTCDVCRSRTSTPRATEYAAHVEAIAFGWMDIDNGMACADCVRRIVDKATKK